MTFYTIAAFKSHKGLVFPFDYTRFHVFVLFCWSIFLSWLERYLVANPYYNQKVFQTFSRAFKSVFKKALTERYVRCDAGGGGEKVAMVSVFTGIK